MGVGGPGFGHRVPAHTGPGLSGGLLSLAAYTIVLWAQSFGNLALVAALRETGVLFAGLIAAVVFKERLTRVQTLALGLAVTGIVLMKAV
jgi:drug/metabolite transporter (DMT)-like permease